MASLLRQIVAGPRARHPEAGLDLCYVSTNIIATSGPSGTYPQLAYRNPLKQLVKFLDDKHGEDWAIWEFRAEGTGYPDSEVYNRIYHYPWPDHHPPPFALIPLIMGSMRNWLKGDPATRKKEMGESVDEHATKTQDQEQLAQKLEAGQVDQTEEQESATRQQPTASDAAKDGSASATNEGDPLRTAMFHELSTAPAPSPPPKDIKAETSKTTNGEAAESSDDVSGASTPSSAKQRKAVRWRESTLVMPMGGAEAQKPKKVDHAKRVVVVHCKAGKGRSGTVSVSYLISEEGWEMSKALQRFTERRMRPGFGAGVSIPSQLRWISYVDRWTKVGQKRYVERPVEITEVHVWGMRDRVKVAIEGFRDQGRRIEAIHVFDNKSERMIVREEGADKKAPGITGIAAEVASDERDHQRSRLRDTKEVKSHTNGDAADKASQLAAGKEAGKQAEEEVRRARTQQSLKDVQDGGDVVFRPSKPILLETSDVCLDFERRNKGVVGGNLSMVTSVAHVWFNVFFEGAGPERGDDGPLDSGVFEIDWDKMDGIKGSSRKGTRAFDRMAVVWKIRPDLGDGEREVKVPSPGEGITDTSPADWRGVEEDHVDGTLALGGDNLSDSSEGSKNARGNAPASTDKQGK